MINQKQSGFCNTYSFKILVWERKYNNEEKITFAALNASPSSWNKYISII